MRYEIFTNRKITHLSHLHFSIFRIFLLFRNIFLYALKIQGVKNFVKLHVNKLSRIFRFL